MLLQHDRQIAYLISQIKMDSYCLKLQDCFATLAMTKRAIIFLPVIARSHESIWDNEAISPINTNEF